MHVHRSVRILISMLYGQMDTEENHLNQTSISVIVKEMYMLSPDRCLTHLRSQNLSNQPLQWLRTSHTTKLDV